MTDKKEMYRLSRIEEACENNFYPSFFDFYDERFQMKISDIMKGYDVRYLFFGGNENAERKMLCIFPDYCQEEDLEWPIMSLVFEKKEPLDHRNVLGTLMSLGIGRELIGDIDVGQKWVQVIFHERIKDFLLNNFTKIKHSPIQCEIKTVGSILSFEHEYKRLAIVVASDRIDGIIGKIFGNSRQVSLDLIRQKKVRLNYEEVTKKDGRIAAGDIIAVRGKGKAKIISMDEKTKKGNIKMLVDLYI